MNLVDAVKSEKRLKRGFWSTTGWCYFDNHGILRDNFYKIIELHSVDLIAEDWIIEGEKISLSWDEIKKAIHDWTAWIHTTERAPFVDYESIKKILGFKE